jgi:hypothetical protein
MKLPWPVSVFPLRTNENHTTQVGTVPNASNERGSVLVAQLQLQDRCLLVAYLGFVFTYAHARFF